jgi:hypothetical protein
MRIAFSKALNEFGFRHWSATSFKQWDVGYCRSRSCVDGAYKSQLADSPKPRQANPLAKPLDKKDKIRA